MIGQKTNLEIIKKWRLKRSTPRFILITGQGEKLKLATTIANTMNSNIVIVGKKVEEVREVIKSCYTITETLTYIFEHGDEMSSSASNAILKITEEPPNNAYFIILSDNENNILSTIKNRAQKLETEPYTKQELAEITNNSLLLEYCDTPEQINKYLKDIKNFEMLVKTCKDFIHDSKNMSGVDVLRIAEKMKFKEGDEGYEPTMFVEICKKIVSQDVSVVSSYWVFLSISRFTLRELSKVGVKKDAAFDGFLLGMRDILC